jgi:hypothetical protein
VDAVVGLTSSQQRTLSTSIMSDIIDTPLDRLQPVTIDNKPLKYNDNPATIPGIKAAFEDWSVRTGTHQTYFKHGMVLIASSGKLAVESVDAVKFYKGEYSDPKGTKPRGLSNPAPSTPARIAAINAAIADPAKHIKIDPSTRINRDDPFIYSPELCTQANRDVHKSWSFVLGTAESTKNALKASMGMGIALMGLLDDLYAKCTEADKALVTTKHNALAAAGIIGELSLESFRMFTEQYDESKLTLHPAIRKAVEMQELQMVNTHMQREPEMRTAYEYRTLINPPTSYADACEIVRNHLGLPQAEVHRAVYMRSGNHRPVGGGQRRRLLAQVRRRTRSRRVRPHASRH